MDINEILSRYPEEKPLTLNYATVREDIQALVADNGLLFDEVLNLARESVKRELKLAKLEAEVARWAQAEADGLLAALPRKEGDTIFSLCWSIKNEKYELHTSEIKNVRYDSVDGSITVSDGERFRVLGKTTFLTREAAEAALEGAGG